MHKPPWMQTVGKGLVRFELGGALLRARHEAAAQVDTDADADLVHDPHRTRQMRLRVIDVHVQIDRARLLAPAIRARVGCKRLCRSREPDKKAADHRQPTDPSIYSKLSVLHDRSPIPLLRSHNIDIRFYPPLILQRRWVKIQAQKCYAAQGKCPSTKVEGQRSALGQRSSEKAAVFPTCPPHPIRRASPRGRGGVFDLTMEVGWGHALIPTFFEGVFGVICCLLSKTVAITRFDGFAFPVLPIPPLPLCASARVLPIPSGEPPAEGAVAIST